MGLTLSTAGVHSGLYDLDGWRLASLERGGHILDLRLGQGFMIYSLAVWDLCPADWVLAVIDCAVAHVDQEVLAREVAWSAPLIELPVPREDGVPGPVIWLLEGPSPRGRAVLGARIRGSVEPLTWSLELDLEGAVPGTPPHARLLCDASGCWELQEPGGRGCAKVAFWAGFQVHSASHWAPDRSASPRPDP